jgi:cytochrome P450
MCNCLVFAPTTYGHIPFGGGPHRCLGDRLAIFQAIVILATVLRSVDLAAVDPRDEPVHLKAGLHIPGNGATVHASRVG